MVLVLWLFFLVVCSTTYVCSQSFLPDHLFPESTPVCRCCTRCCCCTMCYWKYPLAAAANIIFSTGRHLAAAAGFNPVTPGAIEIRLVAPSYHWFSISYACFLRSILEISMLLEPVPKTYDNSGNIFTQAGTVFTTYCIGKMCRQSYLIDCKQLQKLVLR